uniref:Ig-like domain-containing protein n=1 Tax=Oryzias latipes TaxID=8090 RepID=A0A3P9KWF3_ORYLA
FRKIEHILLFLFTFSSALSWAQKTSASLHFQSVLVGEEVTLKCNRQGTGAESIYWYKQPLGLKPQLMSEYLDIKRNLFFIDAFKNDPRLKLETDKDKHHLKISNLKMSDSATYYCISSDFYGVKHLEGYTVHVKDSTSDIHASVDQSSSENIHAGDSVTLNCTVGGRGGAVGRSTHDRKIAGSIPALHAHESKGLIYTHGGRNDQCGRKNNTQTHSCVYELHMERLTESHAGIYYCAVVSCGHILFGNGTKLDLTGEFYLRRIQFVGERINSSELCDSEHFEDQRLLATVRSMPKCPPTGPSCICRVTSGCSLRGRTICG